MESSNQHLDRPATMRVVICGPNLRDQSKGQFHVHREECQHIALWRRREPAYTDGWTIDADSRQAIVEHIYADHIREAQDVADWEALQAGIGKPLRAPRVAWRDFDDLHLFPCCNSLPVTTLAAPAATGRRTPDLQPIRCDNGLWSVWNDPKDDVIRNPDGTQRYWPTWAGASKWIRGEATELDTVVLVQATIRVRYTARDLAAIPDSEGADLCKLAAESVENLLTFDEETDETLDWITCTVTGAEITEQVQR